MRVRMGSSADEMGPLSPLTVTHDDDRRKMMMLNCSFVETFPRAEKRLRRRRIFFEGG